MAQKNTGASARAKAYGLGSISEVVRLTQLSRKAIETWYTTRPELFEIILKGCAVEKGGSAIFGHLENIDRETAQIYALLKPSPDGNAVGAALHDFSESMKQLATFEDGAKALGVVFDDEGGVGSGT